MSLGSHTLFLLNDGTIKACGNNNSGQLGIGNTTNQLSPIVIPITNVKQFYCGNAHTLFLLNDGTVKACGNNANGQLGIGNTTNQLSIVNIPITNIKQIACGSNYTMFLLNDGTVKACGYNTNGQLGIADITNQLNPVVIPITNVKQIYCGSTHTLFLLNDGTVKACGLNTYGQLGIGNTTNQSSPVTVSITNVKQIACGSMYTMFLLNDGTVKACGFNINGQLGIGNTTDQLSPIVVPIANVKQIACGNGFTMFLLNDGTVKSCGINSSYQLGNGNTTNQISPVVVPITNVKQLALGNSFDIFLLNDGTVKVCGNNVNGQLGIGNTTTQSNIVNNTISDVKLLFDNFLAIITLLKQNNLFYSIKDSYYDTVNKTYNPLSTFDILQSFEISELCAEKIINGETFKPIDKFDRFQIITSENAPIIIKGIKTNKELIVANGDINTTVADNIDSFTISYNLSGNGNIKIVVSIDSGLTWKTYDGTTFIDIQQCVIPLKNYNELSTEELVQWNDAITKISTNGITPAVFNTINFNLLNAEKIRFAYVIEQQSINDTSETTELDWQFDAKGIMKKMIDSEYVVDLYSKQIKITPLISNSIIKANVMV